MSKTLLCQDNSLTVIGGMRINPFVIIDYSDGKKQEFTRLNVELGALVDKKKYFSVGYTPYSKSIYTFDEYWILGLDSRFPASMVGIIEYNLEDDKGYYNAGINLKFLNGNGIVLLGSRFDEFDLKVKIGAFIPLNWILYQR
jgi:hypothetical protein